MGIKTLFLGVLSFLLLACSDNIFENNISDDGSGAAKAVELEKALNNKNYDYIISVLSNDSEDYTVLTVREKYLLQMAWLGKSGFNTLDVLSWYFKGDTKVAQILLSSLGGGAAGSAQIKEKHAYYDKVMKMTKISSDNDILTAGGIAGALDTLMVLSDAAIALGGGDISFDKNDPNYIGKIFEGKTDAEIKAVLDSYVGNIASNIDLLEQAVDSIQVPPDKDGDIKKKFDEFIGTITTGSGTVTSDSIVSFIRAEIQ